MVPACGVGLSCAARSITVFGLVLRPSDLSLFGLIIPWAYLLFSKGVFRKPLLIGLAVQAWLAITIQIISLRENGVLCPYCVALTLLYTLLAISAYKEVAIPRTVYVGAALLTAGIGTVGLFMATKEIDMVKNHPINLVRLNELGNDIPEAVSITSQSKGGSEWLLIIDPNCHVCDSALGTLSANISRGDSAKVLISSRGSLHAGELLFRLLEGKSVDSQVKTLAHWPELRGANKDFTPSQMESERIRRSELRTTTLSVRAFPTILVRHGRSSAYVLGDLNSP